MTNRISPPGLEQFQRTPENAVTLFGQWILSLINVIDTTNLFIHDPKVANGKSGKVTLVEMAQALGIVDSSILEKLSEHQKRLAKYERVQWIYILAALVLLIILFLLVVAPVYDLGSEKITSLIDSPEANTDLPQSLLKFLEIVLFTLLIFLIYLILFIPLAIALKLIAILTDKKYAESINIWTLVCLIIELADDNVLRNLASRKALIKRLHDLGLGTSLLSVQYRIKDKNVNTWSRKHFHNIEHYVLERECWVIAPLDTTLEDLRRDFRWLFDIYIHNLYGRVAWQEDNLRESDDQHLGWSDKTIAFLPRLMGYLIPIGILVYLILNPQVVDFLNVKADTIGLITLGWGLLGIDTLLGLGVTATIIDSIKGLKDLSG